MMLSNLFRTVVCTVWGCPPCADTYDVRDGKVHDAAYYAEADALQGQRIGFASQLRQLP
jgi:hypothetical protein